MSRLGVTVSTKLGHAVVRNRVRRRLRELYRLHRQEMLPGYDLIVVARVRAVDMPYAKLESSIFAVLHSLAFYGRTYEKLMLRFIRFYRRAISPLFRPPAVSYPPAPSTRWRLSRSTGRPRAAGWR